MVLAASRLHNFLAVSRLCPYQETPSFSRGTPRDSIPLAVSGLQPYPPLSPSRDSNPTPAHKEAGFLYIVILRSSLLLNPFQYSSVIVGYIFSTSSKTPRVNVFVGCVLERLGNDLFDVHLQHVIVVGRIMELPHCDVHLRFITLLHSRVAPGGYRRVSGERHEYGQSFR